MCSELRSYVCHTVISVFPFCLTPEISSLTRIIIKLFTSAYQALSSGKPSYIFAMLSLAPKPGELRSSSVHLLSISRVNTHAFPEHDTSLNSIVPFHHHFKK